MSMSSSSSNKQWSGKLTKKLSGLTESSSKESIQTIAKWVVFHRKQAAAFIEAFRDAIIDSSSSRQDLILSVIAEVMLIDQDTPLKWDRLADLRLQIGEGLLMEVANRGQLKRTEKVSTLLQEWDKNNVFGGPTLIHQIRKTISKEHQPEKSSKTNTEEGKQIQQEQREQQDETKKPPSRPPPATSAKPSPSPQKKASSSAKATDEKPSSSSLLSPSSSSLTKELVEYDFESKGIPAKRVEPKEFLEPCRAIATLQIARDLRNDNAVQLSSLLQSLPEDIRATVATAAETGQWPAGLISSNSNNNDDEKEDDDDAMLRDFSLRSNESLIDTDLAEQLQSLQTFRDIVSKQRAERQKLIDLLVQSRCEFGANQAAEAFLQADRAKTALQKRAQILRDAMELEGLEVEEPEEQQQDRHRGSSRADQSKKEQDDLPLLTWYKPNQEDTNDGVDKNSASAASKRQKVVE